MASTTSIVYASETGNAEELAYSIYDETRNCTNHNVNILKINELSVQDLQSYHQIIFIVSTAGDGEVPTMMRGFWNVLLRKSTPVNLLSGVRFAVFGLGDTSYEKFNAAARKLFVRLKQIGATPITELGLGDDQAKYGYYSAFNPWKKKLYEVLEMEFSESQSLDSESSNYLVSYLNENDHEITVKNRLGLKGRFQAKVTMNQRLTEINWNQDVRLIGLEIIPERSDLSTNEDVISKNNLLYQPGDVAVIYYRNNTEIVERALKIFKRFDSTLHDDSRLLISTQNNYQRSSRLICRELKCSLRELLTNELDIGAIPHRSYFAALSRFAIDDEERAKLLELASPEGTDLYFDYCLREKRNYIEILEEFHSLRGIPLTKFLEMIPRIPPREYSIASSPLKHPLQVELCVAVASYRTPYGRQRKGLCSSFLADLQVTTPSSSSADDILVNMDLKHGTIRSSLCAADQLESRPFILVGPGTGVAPMRSLIEHALYQHQNQQQQQQHEQNKSVDVLLFFGNRKRDRDFLFKEDWNTWMNVINEYFSLQVITAFSQDQLVKEYVQHRMKEDTHSKKIFQMLEKGGVVFIAGSANRMPQDVKKAFVEIVMREGQVDQDHAERYINDLIRTKRYLVEAWS